MWNWLRRRPRGWIADYYRYYERMMRENPKRFQEEQERAREWAVQVWKHSRARREQANAETEQSPAGQKRYGS